MSNPIEKHAENESENVLKSAQTPAFAYRITVTGPHGKCMGELYPAEQWPDRAGAEADRFRLRVNRVWHMPGGQKFAFLTLAEACAVLTGEPGPAPAASRPYLPRGSVVRVLVGGLWQRVHTRTGPFQGPDGRWRVFVTLFDEEPFLVSDCKQEVMRDVPAPKPWPYDDEPARVARHTGDAVLDDLDGVPARPGRGPYGHGGQCA